jgi:hypothetical protein
VWERDGGRCTFVGERGHRCGARARLEFDHADPVARGGRAIAERMRLLCRAHNQFEAERVFGKAFMRRKRAGVAAADHPTRDDGQTLDVIAGLRALGMGAGEARRLAAASSVSHPVTLEERLRLALKAHRPRRMTGAPGLKRPDAIASEPPQNQNAIAHSAATA